MKKVFQTISIFFILFLPSICFADKAEDLQKLNDLFKQDILTEEQYNQGVEKILKDEDLQKLKDLYEQGILTQEQYNAGVEKILKNIEKILKDSEEMKKLTELFDGGILTEEQFKEGKQKILNKIGIAPLEDTSTSSQQVEKSSFDGKYEVEIVWTFVQPRVPASIGIRVGGKEKFVFEIKDNKVINIEVQESGGSINPNNSKISNIKFNLKDTGELKGKFLFRYQSHADTDLDFNWKCQIIEKKIVGKLEIWLRGKALALKADIL